MTSGSSRTCPGLEVVYQWADGLYVKAGIAKERAALLVIIGALFRRAQSAVGL